VECLGRRPGARWRKKDNTFKQGNKEGNIDLHTIQRLILINNMRAKCLHKLLLDRLSENPTTIFNVYYILSNINMIDQYIVWCLGAKVILGQPVEICPESVIPACPVCHSGLSGICHSGLSGCHSGLSGILMQEQ